MATIAVFGGTGRTGRLVVEEALAAGHRVRILARTAPDSATRDRVTVVRGDVLDPVAVDATVAGSDLVISVFGQVKGSPPTLQTDGTRLIVESMRSHGLRRIVSLSGGGLPDPAHDRPKLGDRVIRRVLALLSPQVLTDAAGHLAVLQSSGLDWTVARGPVLTNGPRTDRATVSWVGVDAKTRVSRADLAGFIVAEAFAEAHVRALPFVSGT